MGIRPQREEPVPQTPQAALAVETGHVQWAGTRQMQNDVLYVTGSAQGRGLLMALADGIGLDAEAGRAAAGAVSAVQKVYEAGKTDRPLHERLLQMAGSAHKTVLSMNQKLLDSGRPTTGATMALALVRGDRLATASVGNVRVFLMRQGCLLQLNRDHLLSLEAEERDILEGESPELDPEMAKMVTSYLGMEGIRQMDFMASPLRLCRGDTVFLMSSGLYGVLPEEKLAALLQGVNAQEACDRVIRAVRELRRESQSNISLIVMKAG